MGSNAQLAAADPTVTEFEASVEAVDGRDVWLSESYFYAESGGQPADRGWIEGIEVETVQVVDGNHVHRLATAPDFGSGDAVACSVDPEFRTYCRRAHTASHVLYGAGRRLFDELGYGGFGITESKVRVDLVTPDPVDDDELVELERLTNRAVWESRAVSWESAPVEEARNDDSVAFNTKTEEGVFAESDEVRVVTVEGWDRAACGGTHVTNTRDIGPVTVLDRSNPGEGMTRVEFAVGPTGIDRRADEKRALLSTAEAAGVGTGDLADEVARLRGERDDLQSELDDLRSAAVEATLSDLDPVERGGYTLAAGVVDEAGPNEVADPLKSAAGEVADAVALAGRDGSTFLAVATGGESEVDAGDLVDEATAEFGGGGGGSPEFAQGGGIDADPGEVVEFLR